MPEQPALLLIAHGSRYAAANADLDWLAEALGRRGGYGHVQTSYLELAEPNIDTAGERCVAAGAGLVVMVPYFLSAGLHVREDLKAARDRLAGRFEGVEFRLAEPIGRHPLLVEVIAGRITEVVS